MADTARNNLFKASGIRSKSLFNGERWLGRRLIFSTKIFTCYSRRPSISECIARTGIGANAYDTARRMKAGEKVDPERFFLILVVPFSGTLQHYATRLSS